MPTGVATLALATLLVAACVTDLRTRRIPNGLVLAGAIAGLGLQAGLPAGRGLFDAAQPGAIGVAWGLVAMGLALLAGVLPWRARLLGAGDTKLLAAVGVYVGPGGLVPVLLGTLLLGGVLALIVWTWKARRARSPWRSRPHALPQPGPTRLPYALAIAAGTTAHVVSSLLAAPAPGA